MNTNTIELSEIFMSLEGEGPHNSRPTAYIRFARCNFSCAKFNNPTNEITSDGYAPLSFDPKNYTSLQDIPLISSGCDTQYGINPAFAHMWEKLTVDQIADRIKAILPRGEWVHPETGLPVILSLTGGEPMLKWKNFKAILNHPFISQCKHVLVETNCSVPLPLEVVMDINQWLCGDLSRHWTWSNSPKLAASGEPWNKAIKPQVANKQLLATGRERAKQMDQYFKFVCGPDQAHFDEVKLAMNEYYAAGVPKTSNVYIMPMACTNQQQNKIAQDVAKMCMDQGFIFCYRLQNSLWGNGIGC